MLVNFICGFYVRLKRFCQIFSAGSPMAGRRWVQLVLGVMLGFLVTTLITRAFNIGHTINLTSVMTRNQDMEDLRRGLKVSSHLRVEKFLTEKPVRVMVMVITAPKNWKKAAAVRRTWGKRIKHIFIASKPVNATKPSNDTLELDVPEGREHLTAKSMYGLRHLYEHYRNDADWFMKVDDDTYVIVENLRHFLSQQNSSEPVYFGQIFMKYVKQGYNSGGAGYVLSKEALSRMHAVTKRKHACRHFGAAEDLDIGRCMNAVGVKVKETVDAAGKSRFNCFTPEMHMFGPFMPWYPAFDKYGGKRNISGSAITFHYIDPQKMDALDYFLYTLKVHGE